MKYTESGIYELTYKAVDKCGNETDEVGEVLVARNIIAGDNVTLTQEGNDATIDVDVCGALDECQAIIEMQNEINNKQDALSAGDHITIENGVISATGMTKQEILTELGYTEIEMSITDENDQAMTVMVLGYTVQ